MQQGLCRRLQCSVIEEDLTGGVAVLLLQGEVREEGRWEVGGKEVGRWWDGGGKQTCRS